MKIILHPSSCDYKVIEVFYSELRNEYHIFTWMLNISRDNRGSVFINKDTKKLQSYSNNLRVNMIAARILKVVTEDKPLTGEFPGLIVRED